MISGMLPGQEDSASGPIDTKPVRPGPETKSVGPMPIYLFPNRSTIRAQESESTSDVQVSSDVKTTEDLGHESYSSGSAASQIEPDRFQETHLLTPEEVRERAYAALERARKRRQELQQQEVTYEQDE